MALELTPNYIRQAAPVTILSTRNGTLARIECAACGSHDEWRLSNRPPPETLPKHFQTKGWETSRKATCPLCAAKRAKPAKPKEPIVNSFDKIMNIVPKPQPDARTQRREAHDLITMAFDIPAGRYNEGYSDERIAKETGISKDWVRQRREDEFGPLKEPNELAAVRIEISDLKLLANGMAAKLDKLAEKNGWKV